MLVSLPQNDRPTPAAQSRPRRPVRTATRTWSATNPAENRTLGLKVWTGGRGACPLPLSAVLLDNKKGCAWPDRTSFRKKIQDRQQGPKALCRGVSGEGFPFQNKLLASRGGWPIPKLGESPNARDHYPPVSGVQEPELLHHQEQEDHHRPSRVLQVLQHVPQAHRAQRDEVRAAPGRSFQPLAGRQEPGAKRSFGGVSSTVKLSVSKTELLGSNPSSPASFPARHLSGKRLAADEVFSRKV